MKTKSFKAASRTAPPLREAFSLMRLLAAISAVPLLAAAAATIQQAVDAAVVGDEIVVTNGTKEDNQ